MNSKLLPALLAASLLSVAGAEYVSAQYGFSATAPKGWKQVDPPGVVVAFTAPSATAGFSTNINVAVRPVPANMSLARYTVVTNAALKQVITEYKLLGSRDITLSGKPGKELMFSGKQGKFTLYFIQNFAFSNGKVYSLTGTTQLEDKAGLAEPMATFARGFKIKP
ncbi:DcrB-related protein [Deinococcus sp.]|uniref:DcrB-related protein n=1 Tax=Deinococcus sp. TaxID=47478 RepID=UPI0025E401E8|nr:DcrB-related protein [Deinococcus sp.]